MPKPMRSWKNTLKRRCVRLAWSVTGPRSRHSWPRAMAGPQEAPSLYRTQGVGFARLCPSIMENANSTTCQHVICQMKALPLKPGKISSANCSSSFGMFIICCRVGGAGGTAASARPLQGERSCSAPIGARLIAAYCASFLRLCASSRSRSAAPPPALRTASARGPSAPAAAPSRSSSDTLPPALRTASARSPSAPAVAASTTFGALALGRCCRRLSLTVVRMPGVLAPIQPAGASSP
mmetsp:Transcript_75892/g.214614  ORF Transcript_75892/g.214614 Transcript_75892/m.214614 type:complete len:238 (+) Transcript_75892:689-1402(+)